MTRKTRKLSLHRETIRTLSQTTLERAVGAAGTFVVPSQYCPLSYWGPQSCGFQCAASRINPCVPIFTDVKCTLIC